MKRARQITNKHIRIKTIATVGIKDLSDGLEKITVRMLHMGGQGESSKDNSPPNSGNREAVWQRTFSKMLAHTLLTESLKGSTRPLKTKVSFTGKLSLRTLMSWAYSVIQKLARTSRKSQALAVVALVIVISAYALLSGGTPQAAKAPRNTAGHSSLPTISLTQGTPDYNTILPAGKTIQNFGGWTRVSPKDANAVYAYVDKVGSVQVDVSEQPLPPGFQVNTDAQVAQVASGYHATEKVPALNTNLYIATLADDSQAVIFTKDNLLILMKSVSLLPPSDWVTYVNALQ